MSYQISISAEPVENYQGKLPLRPKFGADLQFLGVVREMEGARRLRGIDYSCYKSMALRQMEMLCEEMRAKTAEHMVLIHHRIGFVAIGDASIVIQLQTPHSKEAYELCQEYLKRIKTSVPIWKEPVFVDEG